MDLDQFSAFMGWCLIINLGFYFLSFLFVTLFKNLTIQAHKVFFNVDEEFLTKFYYEYIARYKLLIITFNLVPYLALRLALS